VLSFSRNFGHQTAISSGIHFSRGEVTIIMDGDLQDPPELIPQMLEKHNEGHEVVYAVRKNRKESMLLRGCYALFYRLLSSMSNIQIPLDAGDFCLMDQKVVRVIQSMPEQCRFVRGMRSWAGFRQVGLEYDRDARFAGKPTYALKSLIKLALDGMFSFSYVPLRFASVLGFLLSVLSMLVILFMVVDYFNPISIFGLQVNDIPGRASFISAILFVGGTQLMFMGLIGEYIGRIFDETKRRPHWVLKQALGISELEPCASATPEVP
jgi:dolichol-phosphate mannosyltransferase